MGPDIPTVTRWRRFGHDRAYVTMADGTKAGYRDLSTGINHAEAPEHAGVVREAVDAWIGHSGGTTPALPDAQPDPFQPDPFQPEPVQPQPVEPAWADLAAHRPGAMARLQAVTEWERRKAERPVMSRVGRLLNVHNDERAWRMGADGEEAVGARLERLAAKDPRWRVLHAVPVGKRGSDIDHVVIGPAGVMTINAKHHDNGKVWVGGDTLMVNGQRQPYVRNSRHEAKRATRLLSAACGFDVPVVGVIALVGVIEIKTKKAPEDIEIVRRKDIERWLRRRPVVLVDEQIERVYEQARRSTTWQPDSGGS